MELSIIDRGETVGTASMESDGIYWKLVCRLTQKKNSPIRLYGLHLWQSEYLGIPDRFLHPLIIACSLTVTDDGLRSLCNPLQWQKEQLGHADHDCHGTDVKISGGSVALIITDQTIQCDLDH